MWFGYSPEIIEKHPEIAAAVIWVNSFENLKQDDRIHQLLREGEECILQRCPERSAISQQPPIAAWRDAYSRMGLKPNRYPCATEQLMRRVVDGQSIPRISALVDLGNATALRFMIPVAPFDTGRVQQFCEVRHARGNERFWPINGDTPDEIPGGEVIFADDSTDVISRRWAWRQSNKGKVTPDTSQVVIVVEAVHDTALETVREAGEFLIHHLDGLLGAESKMDLLSSENPRSTR